MIGLALSIGGTLPPMYLVGCEPGMALDPDSEDIVASLSAPVHAALSEGVQLVESLCGDLAQDTVDINNRR